MVNTTTGGNNEATPSASQDCIVVDMTAHCVDGLNNGDIIQLKTLASALQMYNKHGMFLTNPFHINRCFGYWMEKAGEKIGRPTWKTKEKLLHKHYAKYL